MCKALARRVCIELRAVIVKFTDAHTHKHHAYAHSYIPLADITVERVTRVLPWVGVGHLSLLNVLLWMR